MASSPWDPARLQLQQSRLGPVRAYLLTESYSAGDRISHPTLGTGVIQGSGGVGKVRVLFDEKKVVLVHERLVSSPST